MWVDWLAAKLVSANVHGAPAAISDILSLGARKIGYIILAQPKGIDQIKHSIARSDPRPNPEHQSLTTGAETLASFSRMACRAFKTAWFSMWFILLENQLVIYREEKWCRKRLLNHSRGSHELEKRASFIELPLWQSFIGPKVSWKGSDGLQPKSKCKWKHIT